MKINGVTSVLLLALILANTSAGQAQARMVLRPGEFCSGQPGAAVATFEDARLEAAIRARLSLDAGRDLTCSLVSGLTDLTAQNAGIESLVGIQNLTGLTDLELNTNSITDISPLSGLTSLTELGLDNNSITDISPLSGLTSLRWLTLWYNSITDISALSGLTKLGGPLRALTLSSNPDLSNIQPLLDNTGLGAGDTVVLNNTNVSCADVAALEAKGVTVVSDCP